VTVARDRLGFFFIKIGVANGVVQLIIEGVTAFLFVCELIEACTPVVEVSAPVVEVSTPVVEVRAPVVENGEIRWIRIVVHRLRYVLGQENRDIAATIRITGSTFRRSFFGAPQGPADQHHRQKGGSRERHNITPSSCGGTGTV